MSQLDDMADDDLNPSSLSEVTEGAPWTAADDAHVAYWIELHPFTARDSGLIRMYAALRSSQRQGEELRADATRLAKFAAMLEASAGSKLDGLIEVSFSVQPPDGGCVGVAFGLNDPSLGSCALDALRAAIDSRSTPA